MSNPLTLEVAFDSPEEFGREYANNILNGGIFVATTQPPAIRAKVRVRVVLAYIGETIRLAGEAVHVITPELATAGATAGVAVQFEARASELRSLFEPLLARTEEAGRPTEAAASRTEDERRAAPRSRARVRARVYCPGYEAIEGRTRDLSSSGVLVSVSGEPPIPVGEPVQVFITHPETGFEREILGKIARHVRGEGGVVRAVGVQFYIPEEERAEVERFLRELKATEHNRHLGGIQGTIEELGLVNLVQTFALAAREGTLDVIRGVEEGFLAFEDGTLRAAGLGGTTGVKALARMLTWSEGRFEFHARVDPTLPCDPIPLEAALLEAMRLMDESADVDRRNFPPDATLRVDHEAWSAAGPLTKLDEAVLDLAATGMNLQRILDIVPETDDEIYLALAGLADLGVILLETA